MPHPLSHTPSDSYFYSPKLLPLSNSPSRNEQQQTSKASIKKTKKNSSQEISSPSAVTLSLQMLKTRSKSHILSRITNGHTTKSPFTEYSFKSLSPAMYLYFYHIGLSIKTFYYLSVAWMDVILKYIKQRHKSFLPKSLYKNEQESDCIWQNLPCPWHISSFFYVIQFMSSSPFNPSSCRSIIFHHGHV